MRDYKNYRAPRPSRSITAFHFIVGASVLCMLDAAWVIWLVKP